MIPKAILCDMWVAPPVAHEGSGGVANTARGLAEPAPRVTPERLNLVRLFEMAVLSKIGLARTT